MRSAGESCAAPTWWITRARQPPAAATTLPAPPRLPLARLHRLASWGGRSSAPHYVCSILHISISLHYVTRIVLSNYLQLCCLYHSLRQLLYLSLHITKGLSFLLTSALPCIHLSSCIMLRALPFPITYRFAVSIIHWSCVSQFLYTSLLVRKGIGCLFTSVLPTILCAPWLVRSSYFQLCSLYHSLKFSLPVSIHIFTCNKRHQVFIYVCSSHYIALPDLSIPITSSFAACIIHWSSLCQFLLTSSLIIKALHSCVALLTICLHCATCLVPSNDCTSFSAVCIIYWNSLCQFLHPSSVIMKGLVYICYLR